LQLRGELLDLLPVLEELVPDRGTVDALHRQLSPRRARRACDW
jgi:hypothetical protein